MTSSDGRFSISYNGEIYNYLELRRTLIGLGTEFRTESDTEVILESWRQWGDDSPSHFNGMFAFAIVDHELARLWLVRDRFGVKPLYWGRISEGTAFASTAAVVSEVVNGEPDIDYALIALRTGCYADGQVRSPFRGVMSVAPGTLVSLDLHQPTVIKQKQYYNLAEKVAQARIDIAGATEEELQLELEARLVNAVRLRLRSDVEVGLSVSGGLDSNLLAALSVRESKTLRAFSYGDPADRQTEGPLTSLIASTLGVEVDFVAERDVGVANLLLETVKRQQAPFRSPSIMVQGEVFRRAKNLGVSVLLGGQGADELLMGYRKYLLMAAGRFVREGQLADAGRTLSSLGRAGMLEIAQGGNPLATLARYVGLKKRHSVFALPVTYDLPRSGSDRFDRELRKQFVDIEETSLPSLLRYEDRNSMGFGVETRLPYLDYRFAEFALALPNSLKVRRGFGKYVLRRIGAPLLPSACVWNRTKRGYDARLTSIDREKNGGEIIRFLKRGAAAAEPFLRESAASTVSSMLRHSWTTQAVFADATTLLWLGVFTR
jgi:asparagine synthase (glutamine-hydrolysing)